MSRRIAALLWLVALIPACGTERVIVGAGTTTVDSGLIAAIEAEYGRPISVVAGSTAELLELARQGAVDVVIVHDEAQELKFMTDRPDATREAVFVSHFLIVGPPADVATIEARTAADVFAEISTQPFTFVSRDDGSGTHSREIALWSAAGVEPPPRYIRTGQGMGLTLQVADQADGFTLVEAGVFVAAADTIDLVPVPISDPDALINRYSAILVGPGGSSFFEWLTGDAGAAAVRVADAMLFDSPVYVPVR